MKGINLTYAKHYKRKYNHNGHFWQDRYKSIIVDKENYLLACASYVEAKISLAKRKFGMNHIKYRIDGAEEMWIRLGLMAMNLKMAINTS